MAQYYDMQPPQVIKLVACDKHFTHVCWHCSKKVCVMPKK